MFGTATISFFVFVACFTGIGILAANRQRRTPDDYLLASRDVNPYLVALSAVSTQNSGFMFVGLTGSAYTLGIHDAFWLSVGWVVGDALSWTFVHRRLREASERSQSRTVAQFLADGSRPIALIAGLVTLVFLSVYAAAQLTAASKALSTYDIDSSMTVILGALVVVIYCFAGGIRASIWTDAAQSTVMLLSMALLLTVAIIEIGSVSELWRRLAAEDAKLVAWFPDPRFGFPLFLLGWVAAGFGVVGQPHVMVRYMSIDRADNLRTARWVYLSWFALFSLLCVGVGLAARALFPLGSLSDAELAFPVLAESLLPGVAVGLMLAGLFAATISTADSQVLSCSAAIAQDLVPRWRHSFAAVKIATLVVTVFAAGIALAVLHVPRFNSVFQQVVFAWSALAGSLGPLLVVRCLGAKVTSTRGVAMMVAGLVTVLGWRFGLQLQGQIYDALPAMVAGFAVYLVSRKPPLPTTTT